uniref:DUF4246 domain-containing protein n=1 Tax=Clytia hemisphaerica TaxID=252671 RepID=A0A7M5V327_9CNID
MSSLQLEETKFPTKRFLENALQMVRDFYREHELARWITGEKLTFKQLKPKDGFEFVEAVVEGRRIDGPRSKYLVRVKLDVSKKIPNDQLSTELEEYFDFVQILEHKVLESTDYEKQHLELLIHFSGKVGPTIVSSPFYDLLGNGNPQNKIITEGVCYSKYKVPDDLRDSLRKNIDKLASETEIDYHPNSNDVVRDLVHPALYPYVKGVSEVQETKENCKSKETEDPNEDFWGRPYEDSKFQWLPSPFYISLDGNCFIGEYINNLDKEKFPELYRDLERLFELFLPYFEEVWAYAKGMMAAEISLDFSSFDFQKPFVDIRDQELQVITKIVDYTLQPGQSYEGVWHTEGMSHENIVMTGLYFNDRDTDLTGGDLRFKRAFHIEERAQFIGHIIQCRPIVVDDFAQTGYRPLGHFPTEEGYLMVFPNCHIHKIAKFVNESATKAASRRIVVFFVVNPEKKIISTREVAPQQGKISLSDAKKYRLELMAERKYDKEKLNVRDLELCEH